MSDNSSANVITIVTLVKYNQVYIIIKYGSI